MMHKTKPMTITINGITYRSYNAAAKKLGVSNTRLRNLLKEQCQGDKIDVLEKPMITAQNDIADKIGSRPLSIHGMKFRSMKTACEAAGNLCVATFLWWQRRHQKNLENLSLDERFAMWLEQFYCQNLVALLLGLVRSKAPTNKSKYILNILQQNNHDVKSAKDYLASFTDIRIGPFTFPTLLDALKTANINESVLEEIAYVKCLVKTISDELLFEVPNIDGYYIGEFYKGK